MLLLEGKAIIGPRVVKEHTYIGPIVYSWDSLSNSMTENTRQTCRIYPVVRVSHETLRGSTTTTHDRLCIAPEINRPDLYLGSMCYSISATLVFACGMHLQANVFTGGMPSPPFHTPLIQTDRYLFCFPIVRLF